MIVVSNSTPLIALSKIGQFNLLKEIFGVIHIPQAVYDEVVEKGKGLPGEKEVLDADWISCFSVEQDELLSSLRSYLNKGESEAIALAKQIEADWIIIDEKLARRCARESIDSELIGTLGILLRAKEMKLISKVSPLLEKLVKSGFRISKYLRREVLKIVGEFRGFIATKEVEDKTSLWEELESKLPPFALTIQENVESIEFDRGIPYIDKLLEKGRSFSEDIEINWQKINDKFRIVALSEDKTRLQDLELFEDCYQVKTVSFLLWGEYNSDLKTFVEVRIPRPLEYPIPAVKRDKNDKRLKITAYNYIKDDIIQFTRYREVVWSH